MNKQELALAVEFYRAIKAICDERGIEFNSAAEFVGQHCDDLACGLLEEVVE